MKIGMMADVYKTQVSGVTNCIRLIKRWLEREGHEVYVFTFGDDGIVDNEKNIIRTPGVPLLDTGIYINFVHNREARRLLYSMDIAHVHHPFISGALAMRYCVPRNIPIIFTNHTRYDLYTHAYVPIFPEQIEYAAVKASLAPFFRACDLVTVPSPSMKHVLEQQFGVESPIEIIPHGLELAPYETISSPIERAKLGFKEDDIILVNVGRLASEKNLSFLLHAFRGVVSIYDHVRLLIVGDGPDRENLETQARSMEIGDKIYFTGMVDYDQVPGYMAAADIFVTPSSTETFGLSTVEAMAAGLPTVGMDAPGTSDIIEDGVTGLISNDDLAVFTAKLILLSIDEGLRIGMGQKAREESQKYDIRNTIQILQSHYQRLIEEARLRKKSTRYHVTRLTDNL